MKDWTKLAELLGPQSAPYMFSEEWDGMLRSIKCRCGALIEIVDDEPTPPPGRYLCDACALRLAFTGDEREIGCAFPYIRGG